MWQVTVALRTAILADGGITALVGNRVYPFYITAIAAPVFPCVTLSRSGGGVNRYHTATEVLAKIDVWSKVGYDELWQIYSRIKYLVNLKQLPIDGSIFFTNPQTPNPQNSRLLLVKETRVNDDLYEQATMTHHLSAQYLVITK